jgi:hypothetical protein
MIEIPTLWPADKVSLGIVSPLAILKKQANALTTLTQGLLVGQVKSHAKDGQHRHLLQVYAPVIEVTYTLMEVYHSEHDPYPVTVSPMTDMGLAGLAVILPCYTESAFVALLAKVLQSDGVLTVINSAIAQSNEANDGDGIFQDSESNDHSDETVLPQAL